MRSTTFVSSFAVLSVSLLVGYQVFAHCGRCAEDGKKIAAQLDKNGFTLAKAVTAAEQHSKGRSISAVSELGDTGEVMIHVYCMTADKIVMCHVDPATGSVKGMKNADEFPTKAHAHNQDDDDHDHDGTGAGGHGGHGGAGAGGTGGAGGAGEAGGSAMMIKGQTLEAGCGSCIYKMAGVEGCPLAVVVNGKPYLVEGAKWPNHDYCDAKQQAVVTGKVEGDKLIVVTLEPKK